MTRRPRLSASGLTLAALLLALVVAPLALPVAEIPGALKGDEAAYYLLAQSLWRDRDALCEEADLLRLFQEFPEGAPVLWLLTPDSWQTAYFGIPFVYPLLAAPAVAVAGARGMMSLNAALLAAMIWMGASYLRRFNPRAVARLYASLFFLLSAASAYVFWLQGEMLIMACLTGGLYLMLGGAGARSGESGPRLFLRTAVSALLMGTVVYLKPPLALIGAVVLLPLARRSRLRELVVWCLAAVATLGALAGVSFALVEEPWVYATPARRTVGISSPVAFAERKIEPLAYRDQESAELWSGRHIEGLVTPQPGNFHRSADALLEFLVGRHVGLVPYLPFALVSIVLLVIARGGSWRWTLLAATLISGIAWRWYVPGAWAGGGAYFGNRYLVIAYPAFLFLVTRVRPVGSLIPATGIASLLLAPGLAVSATPSLAVGDQLHALSFVHRLFPIEITLGTLPGYHGHYHRGAWFRAHRHRVQFRGDELRFEGGVSNEAWMHTAEPLEAAEFEVRTAAPTNRVRLCLEGDCRSVDFSAGEAPPAHRIWLEPSSPHRTIRWRVPRQYVYRLRVETRLGEQPRWRQGGADRFYLGASLVYLGSRASRAPDRFQVGWSTVEAPESIPAGARVEFPVTVVNRSVEAWEKAGATPVHVSYHWRHAEGEIANWEGLRTSLPSTVPPGEAATVRLRIQAPDTPGDYRLELDLVREKVTWFSERSPQAALTVPMRVTQPPG